MPRAKTSAALLVLAVILVALPAEGHDPHKEVGQLEREVRSVKVQLDQALQTAQRNAARLQEKTKQFGKMMDNFNRLSNRLDQSLQSNERLQTRKEALETENDELIERAKAALDVMPDALDHPKAQVRARTATALGAWGPAAGKAVPKLEGLLQDESASVRAAAKAALAKIKSK